MSIYLIKNKIRRFLLFLKNFPWIGFFYFVLLVSAGYYIKKYIAGMYFSGIKNISAEPYAIVIVFGISIYSIFFRKYPIMKLESATYYLFLNTEFLKKNIRLLKLQKIIQDYLIGCVLGFCLTGWKMDIMWIKYLFTFGSFLGYSSLLSWVLFQKKNKQVLILECLLLFEGIVLMMVGVNCGIMIVMLLSEIVIFIFSEKMFLNDEKYIRYINFMTDVTNAEVQIDNKRVEEIMALQPKEGRDVKSHIFRLKNPLMEYIELSLRRSHKKSILVIFCFPIIIRALEEILKINLSDWSDYIIKFNFMMSYILLIFLSGIIKIPVNEIFKQQQYGVLYKVPLKKKFLSTVIFPGSLMIICYAILVCICFNVTFIGQVIPLYIGYFWAFYISTVLNEKTGVYINLIYNIIYLIWIATII